jgi:hypothetical protein
VAGVDRAGITRALMTTDAGRLHTDSSANAGWQTFEFCAATTFDAGQSWEGDGGGHLTGVENPGWALYSIFVPPAGMRALKICNNHSANPIRFTCDGSAPVAGAYGERVSANSGGDTQAAECVSVNLTELACPILSIVSKTADQHSGRDGGLGCTNLHLVR